MEIEENDERSMRINVRIPRKQYDRMMLYGEVLGLDTQSAVIKHFLNLGLQFGGSSLANQIAGDTSKEMLKAMQAFQNDCKTALQTDLIEAASESASN